MSVLPGGAYSCGSTRRSMTTPSSGELMYSPTWFMVEYRSTSFWPFWIGSPSLT